MRTQKRCVRRKPRFCRGFLLPKRRFFTVPKHRCKIAVFPLWIDLNPRKLNNQNVRQVEIKIYLPFLLPEKGEKDNASKRISQAAARPL